jgi:hypothetical protein
MRLFFTILILIAAFPCSGQHDSIPIKKKNQIGLELLGNTAALSFISVNYTRKISSSTMVFGGVGLPHKFSEEGILPGFTSYTIDGGVLYRKNYKRKGFGVGISIALMTGKWYYRTSITRDSAGQFIDHYTYHPVSFEVFPAVYYQYQNKTETFFMRPTVGLKLPSAFFSDSYREIDDDGLHLIPWIGFAFGIGL